jgi:hypothetical protein
VNGSKDEANQAMRKLGYCPHTKWVLTDIHGNIIETTTDPKESHKMLGRAIREKLTLIREDLVPDRIYLTLLGKVVPLLGKK